MATSSENEPTLTEVADRLSEISAQIRNLQAEVEGSNSKFDTYQQATQWVVQLAFTLIASATITIIITSVFK